MTAFDWQAARDRDAARPVRAERPIGPGSLRPPSAAQVRYLHHMADRAGRTVVALDSRWAVSHQIKWLAQLPAVER